MKWVENTKELDKLVSRMEKLSSKSVLVGFFDTNYDDSNEGISVAQVAQWQEEGVKNGADFAPPRPFFRGTFLTKVKSPIYRKAFRNLLNTVSTGAKSAHAACKNLGEGLSLELKAAIDDGSQYAPNSDAWAAHKQKVYGITAPLTYTGFMQDSVKYKIVNSNGKES
jgi:hypothetical protein